MSMCHLRLFGTTRYVGIKLFVC